MNKKNWIMKVFMTTCLFIALSTNLTFASGWTKGISKNAWWFDFGRTDQNYIYEYIYSPRIIKL